jgi:cyclopropane fatty-acyl-phospholipid synthase-like methyltransferase
MRAILSLPSVYLAFQGLVGGTKMRSLCLKLLEPKPGQKIVDIGCGPAYYLAELPAVDYVGFDTDARYINHAKKRFGSRGRFYVEPFTKLQADALGPFDGVLLMGLLHHLDDDECGALLSVLSQCLRPGGRVVTLDTVVDQRQGSFERWLAVNDRGQHVRSPAAFESLAKAHFSDVQGTLPSMPMVPSIYYAMVLSHGFNRI